MLAQLDVGYVVLMACPTASNQMWRITRIKDKAGMLIWDNSWNEAPQSILTDISRNSVS
jgi:hypothetical protein